jgi:hypothetical protein
MTPEASLMIRVADALATSGIPYMLAGSFSSNYYGIPRSTKDADFVVELRGCVGADFMARLGDDFEADPQLSFETNTGTHRQIIFHKESPFKVELFLLSKDPHDQARFGRRVSVEAFTRRLWLPTAEDVIVMKLRWARARDKDDVRAVMGVQAGKLDWAYIEGWCQQHGTTARLEEIRRTVPEV